jgi:hypothetical protein
VIPDYDKASAPCMAAATSAGQHAAVAADAPSPSSNKGIQEHNSIPKDGIVQRMTSDHLVLLPQRVWIRGHNSNPILGDPVC